MIDIFPQIYSGLKAEINSFAVSVPGCSLLGSRPIEYHNAYTRQAQKFPCITIEEKTNTNSEDEMDFIEKSSEIMYEINVYDNSKSRYEVCRAVSNVIDNYMAKRLGFRRVAKEPFPNVADSTIFRYILRYDGYVDNETGNISRIKY